MKKLHSKLTNITPLEMFRLQVSGIMEAERSDKEFTPPHMGGPMGQRSVLTDKLVLNIIDYEGDNE